MGECVTEWCFLGVLFIVRYKNPKKIICKNCLEMPNTANLSQTKLYSILVLNQNIYIYYCYKISNELILIKGLSVYI